MSEDQGKKILIVDDDPHILRLLQLYFEKEQFLVSTAENGDAALARFAENQPDVVLLDLMMPGKSGYDVLRELRKTSTVAILILTARGDTFDKVLGLELGADDYVAKPFEPKELVARVNAVLRRVRGDLAPAAISPQSPPHEKDVLRMANLTVDRRSYRVQVDELEMDLPPKELELLFFLVSHPNRVFSREQLLHEVWGFDYFGESRTVDVHVKRLRAKLDQRPHPDWSIKTVWSVGYMFELRA